MNLPRYYHHEKALFFLKIVDFLQNFTLSTRARELEMNCPGKSIMLKYPMIAIKLSEVISLDHFVEGLDTGV